MDVSLRLAHPFMPFVTEVKTRGVDKTMVLPYILFIGIMASNAYKFTYSKDKHAIINGREIP